MISYNSKLLCGLKRGSHEIHLKQVLDIIMYSLIEKKKLYKSYLLFWSFILRLKPKKFQISVSASIKKIYFRSLYTFQKTFCLGTYFIEHKDLISEEQYQRWKYLFFRSEVSAPIYLPINKRNNDTLGTLFSPHYG